MPYPHKYLFYPPRLKNVCVSSFNAFNVFCFLLEDKDNTDYIGNAKPTVRIMSRERALEWIKRHQQRGVDNKNIRSQDKELIAQDL